MKLETQLLFALDLVVCPLRHLPCHDVDVGLFPCPDLVPERLNDVTGGQGLQGQVVVAGVGQPVAAVPVAAALVLEQSVKRKKSSKVIKC